MRMTLCLMPQHCTAEELCLLQSRLPHGNNQTEDSRTGNEEMADRMISNRLLSPLPLSPTINHQSLKKTNVQMAVNYLNKCITHITVF